MECGEQSLSTPGIILMLKSLAVSWDTLQSVSAYSYEYCSIAVARCLLPSLHFPCAGSVAMTGSYFGRGNSPILISYMRCDGDESSLGACYYSTASVGSTSYRSTAVAGVICQGNTTSQTECSSGDLRLVGGEGESEGRVEVCVDGFWGTVCDQNWSQREAMTVCRQAGLPSTGGLFKIS